MKKVFLIAGEMSGDAHGAGLMRALHAVDPEIQFLGLGGPQMHAAGGAALEDWVADAAVVGLWEVLKMYGWFKARFDRALKTMAEERPDAVVLIDYPGFNLRIAKAIRAAGLKTKIIYYISPQVWAWKKGRIKTMAKVLDLMICIFPFEKQLYEKSGLRTVFAGHPMVDKAQAENRTPREANLVGLFPGSRSNEIKRIFPTLLAAASVIRKARPEVRFAISAANERLAEEIRAVATAAGMSEAQNWIEVGQAHALMQRATVGAVASGTATMEATCYGLPYVLVYRVNLLTYFVGKMVVRIKHLGMANILAGREVVKELVQGDLTAKRVALELLDLLDQEKGPALTQTLREVANQLGGGGAYVRAAEAVLQELSPQS